MLDQVKFDSDGLVPVVTQDAKTKEVLMLAYANREAIEKTIKTGYAHYWSRSRRKLWMKGESSGNVQRVVEVKIDCDGDALLYLVDQVGNACHTGNRTCFFRRLEL
ncbi:MAG: phosphoribosyl-AMP cyclohydrolase [Archaeoglobaceae archaeon]|nr:phosphoribosyl-AMP cyclohydrolase [Archaeoglobaceae archaeon]MCX8151719.1 phosphoribosyl-AMP cyclohydrolase [Archaeoglobaceae archaeon]MDW8013848.1 phosphoribosyl-AMP cyclohydrolase [Archaeoglobaceae archaeon]